jgi:hypothetical protein
MIFAEKRKKEKRKKGKRKKGMHGARYFLLEIRSLAQMQFLKHNCTYFQQMIMIIKRTIWAFPVGRVP